MQENEKVVLITGGTRGIGKAIAKRFAKEGYDLSLNHVTELKDKEGFLKEFERYNVRVMLVQGDVSKFNEVEEMVNKTIAELGQIDVLVNNAGITKD